MTVLQFLPMIQLKICIKFNKFILLFLKLYLLTYNLLFFKQLHCLCFKTNFTSFIKGHSLCKLKLINRFPFLKTSRIYINFKKSIMNKILNKYLILCYTTYDFILLQNTKFLYGYNIIMYGRVLNSPECIVNAQHQIYLDLIC